MQNVETFESFLDLLTRDSGGYSLTRDQIHHLDAVSGEESDFWEPKGTDWDSWLRSGELRGFGSQWKPSATENLLSLKQLSELEKRGLSLDEALHRTEEKAASVTEQLRKLKVHCNAAAKLQALKNQGLEWVPGKGVRLPSFAWGAACTVAREILGEGPYSRSKKPIKRAFAKLYKQLRALDAFAAQVRGEFRDAQEHEPWSEIPRVEGLEAEEMEDIPSYSVETPPEGTFTLLECWDKGERSNKL